MHEHFLTDIENRFQRNYFAPFGFNTIMELIQGKKPDPVANLIGGFTHPGSPVNTTPTTGAKAPLDYTNVLGASTVNNSPDTSGPLLGPKYNGPINNNNNNSSGQTAPTSGGTGYDFGAIIQRQMDTANGLYDRAKGIYDEGKNALASKMTQFKNNFDQGNADILQGYQRGAGELQSSAQGAATRNSNALRALGLGGSAVERTQGRQTQNNMKALASLQDIRGANELQNKTAYDENTQWGNAMDSQLKRSLDDAGYQRQAASNGLMDNLSNIFNNIINNQMAYAASIGQKAANPTMVDIPSMLNTLQGVISNNGLSGGSVENQNVNIDQNDPNYWKKKLLGLN